MTVDMFVEFLFDSDVHGNSIMTPNHWKGKNIHKICLIEMNIKWEQTQWWIFCLILTATIGVDSCGTIWIKDNINNISILNTADGRTGKIVTYLS